MMRLGRWGLLAIGIAAAACSPTIGPVVPSVQVVVVLDSLDDTLRIIPVDSPDVVHKVVLDYNTAVFGKHALALSGNIGVASHGGSVVSFEVVTGHAICDNIFAQGGGIASLVFAEPYVYVASYGSKAIYHFDASPAPCTGEGSALIRGVPRAFVTARGKLYAIARNGENAESWLSTTTGQSTDNLPLSPEDSVPLASPGYSEGAVLGSDGNVYVINSGVGSQNARLSQVNPVEHTELNVIPGFGTKPQFIATDGADRIFVASAYEGLMVYNLRTNRVERDAQSAIPLFGAPRGLVADDVGRIYALTAGSCRSGPPQPGRVQVFGTDLVNTRLVPVGECPVAIAVTDIPATLYHFDH